MLVTEDILDIVGKQSSAVWWSETPSLDL